MKKIIISIFSILLFIILNNNQTFACSCIMNESPSISMEKATSVFIWKVSKIEESSIINDLFEYKKNYVTFNVSSNIKWDTNQKITIVTAKDSATCWYNFEDWKDYIVYTYWEKNEEEVSLCSRTSLLENAFDDLEAFKDIITNVEEIDENEVEANKNFTEIFISLLIIFVSIFAIFIITKPTKD